jgi:Protein of unknown function (DUF2470)
VAEHSAERRDWSPGPLLAHLNQRHPDTVLFVARHLTGNEQLTDAQFVGIQRAQLMTVVTEPDGSRTVPLPLKAAIASRSELLDQLATMLRAAREAKPDEPFTSLESDISGHEARSTSRHRRDHRAEQER